MADGMAAENERELAVWRTAPAGADVPKMLQNHSFAVAIADLQNTAGLSDTGMVRRTIEHHFPEHRTYTREQLRDPNFYAANRDDITRAMQRGRIRE